LVFNFFLKKSLPVKKNALHLYYQNLTTMTTTEKIRNYKGNNNFMNSLKSGLQRYGRLTDKQLAAPINVNVNIKVKRFIAKKIKEENGLEFAPFMLTISKVLRETAKAYQVVGKMTTSDVTSCRCCGKDLTDWRSQATGVGPVCSKNLNIPYVKDMSDVEVYKKLLKLKIDQIGDLTFWLAKSQIVEGYDDLSEAVK
jgi:hypothetical protein